jgi:hypothetical protein
MACHHSNPAGYVFCSACGQPLEYRQCRCGFICAADALYCGRCGHSLMTVESDTETTISAVEHRYDLDLLMQLAGIQHSDKKSQTAKSDYQEDVKQILTPSLQKDGI